MKLKGLGRGLDALLAGNESEQRDQQRVLPLSNLQTGKYQPRTHMDPVSLETLAESIRKQGLMQPILVRPLADDRYEIIAGERRWRAAKMAGLSEVPTLIRYVADDVALAMALVENIQRENLNPLEEAQGIQRLVDEFALTHQQAADAVGRSRSATSNLLRLLQLTGAVQDLLMSGSIDMGHARALLPIEGAAQVQLAQQIAQKGLSVREAERLVQHSLKAGSTQAAKAPPKVDQDVLRLQDELADLLGAKVEIRANRKGAGTLHIRFGDLEELEGILQHMRH
ncbi:MAG: ParB/RepB/Spo0J family partition protein [Pseudomonadota bacterium]